MLKRLHLRNFTVFEDADFEFGPGLNVLVGTNGTGKSHVLKVGYAVELAYRSAANNKASSFSSKDEQEVGLSIGFGISSRLDDVFLPKGMNKLVRRPTSADDAIPNQAEIEFEWGNAAIEGYLGLYIASASSPANRMGMLKNSVIGEQIELPVFIPAKEMLSLMPDIIGLSDKYSDLLDRTYTGLAKLLLVRPLTKTPPYTESILNGLERLLKGRIEAENGRFYLVPSFGERFEINLVAEGNRKLGTLAYLLANGTLTPETTLFWDEPEANLNPALLKEMAAVLTELARAGFQIILATHSLFLMKELHILSQREKTAVKYFGLFTGPGGDTQVETKDDFVQLAHVAALDAELAQTYDFEDALDQDYAGDN